MLSMLGLKPKTQSTDASAVHAAAARLDVSEFEIFRLAYRAWFGRDGNEKSLERVFVVYMFHGQVPAWVRHQCRDMAQAAPPHEAEAVALPDLEQRRHVITLAVAVTIAVFVMTVGSGRIPAGCPGAYVEPAQAISEEASPPIC